MILLGSIPGAAQTLGGSSVHVVRQVRPIVL